MPTKPTSPAKQGKPIVIKFLFPAVVIGSLVAAYYFIPGVHDTVKGALKILTSNDRERISNWVGEFGFWGPLVIIAAMVAQMFLVVINVVALMVVAVLAYGPFWGSVVALAGVFTASTVGYIIGLLTGEGGVNKLIGEKLGHKMRGFVGRYGFWAVVITRISPFLSNDAVSFIAGLARMNYFTFIFATMLGITPLVVLIAWLSTDIDKMKTGLIWVSVLSIAGLVGYILFDHLRKKKPLPAP